MDEKVNRISSDIESAMNEYRNVINSISSHPELFQKDTVDTLDRRVDDMIGNSIKLIAPKPIIDAKSKNEVEKNILELEEVKQNIHKIDEEIKIRSKSFQDAIKKNEKSFIRQNKSMEDVFNDHRKTEIERHNNEMEKMRKEVDRINTKFNNMLAVEVDKYVSERESIEKEYAELGKNFQLMKGGLELQIKVVEDRVKGLSEQIKKSEKINAEKLIEIENIFKKKIAKEENRFKKIVNEKEKENMKLRNIVSLETRSFEEQSSNLQGRIDDITNAYKVMLEDSLNKLDRDFEESYKTKELVYIQEQSSVRDKLKEKEMSVGGSMKNLNVHLSGVLSGATVPEDAFDEGLEMARKEAQDKVNQKEKEFKSYEGKEALDETSVHMSRLISHDQKKNPVPFLQLERELMQVSNQKDSQRKVSEDEINSFTKRGSSRGQKNSSRQCGSSKRPYSPLLSLDRCDTVDIRPYAPNTPRTTDQLLEFFDKTDQQTVQSLQDLRKTFNKRKQDVENARHETQQFIENNEKCIQAIQNEIRVFKARLEGTENKLKECQQQSPESNALQELQQKVGLQRNAINQLNEELQKLSVDESMHQQLLDVQQLHREEINEIESLIAGHEDVTNRLAKELKAEMNEKIEMQRRDYKGRIKKARDSLSEALHDLSHYKYKLGIDIEKDSNRWSELRQSIASQTARIMRSSHRPKTSVKTPVARPKPLPALKRN